MLPVSLEKAGHFAHDVVSAAVCCAGTRTRGQVCTVALGCLIFFDDYSSILIVGNSLRGVVRAVGVRQGACTAVLLIVI